MKTIILPFVVLCVIVSGCCKTDEHPNTSLSASESLFAVKASQGNLGEIQAAQLSLTNAQSDSVKAFGRMMINDHTSAQATLDSIGRVYKFTMPSTPDSADQALQMRLMNLQGVAFDTAYINAQVADHQAALDLLDNERNHGTNAMLKGYSARNYPVVQMHLALAIQLQQKLRQQ